MSEGRKKLSAKEYLGQLEELDISISQDLEILGEMKAGACDPGGIDYSRECVQTSGSGDSLSNAVTRYITFDEQINAEIDRFINTKNKIISEIRGLHNKNYMRILFKVYVQFKSVKQASKEMKMSYPYVIELHNKALSEFERTYKNLHYLM